VKNKNLFILRIFIFLFIFCILFGCDFRYGFVESNFKLSKDSRFPRWFNCENEVSCEDLELNFTFYTHPFLKKVRIEVYDEKKDRKKIYDFVGSYKYHDLTKDIPRNKYPRYIVITVDGKEEVFEHRVLNPFLYVIDIPLKP